MVVVVGGDRDLETIGNLRTHAVGDALADDVGVGAEDHVEVGGDDDGDLLALLLLEGDRGHLHVVVDPVRVRIAVADGHATLVPLGHEQARRERVVRIGHDPVEVVVRPVDRRQDRPRRRADLDHRRTALWSPCRRMPGRALRSTPAAITMVARATASILRCLITAPPSSWWCGLYGNTARSEVSSRPRPAFLAVVHPARNGGSDACYVRLAGARTKGVER